MTDDPSASTTSPAPAAADRGNPPRAPWADPLPAVDAPVPPAEAVAALRKLSQRGKLAGFSTEPAPAHLKAVGAADRIGDTPADRPIFACDVHGGLYDRVLIGFVRPRSGEGDGAGQPAGCRIEFASTLLKKMPLIVAIGFVFVLFPGVWFTDSLLATWFNWYRLSVWQTAAWYVPLTLLAAPVLRTQFRASEAAARIHADETIAKIAATLGGSVVTRDRPADGA
jgi:hypothetical protein